MQGCEVSAINIGKNGRDSLQNHDSTITHFCLGDTQVMGHLPWQGPVLSHCPTLPPCTVTHMPQELLSWEGPEGTLVLPFVQSLLFSRVPPTKSVRRAFNWYRGTSCFPLATMPPGKFHSNESNFVSQEMKVVILHSIRKHLQKGKMQYH